MCFFLSNTMEITSEPQINNTSIKKQQAKLKTAIQEGIRVNQENDAARENMHKLSFRL